MSEVELSSGVNLWESQTKIYQVNKQLGGWVNNQRTQYKKFQRGEKSSITKERISRLDDIGFVWNGNKKRTRDEKIYPKNPKRQRHEPSPDPAPSSSPGFAESETERVRMQNLCDEILVIAVRKADRQVWGINH